MARLAGGLSVRLVHYHCVDRANQNFAMTAQEGREDDEKVRSEDSGTGGFGINEEAE